MTLNIICLEQFYISSLRNIRGLRLLNRSPVKLSIVVSSCLFCCFLLIGQIGYGQTFTEISAQLGVNNFCQDQHIMSGGVAFFDYNGDFYPDIFVIGGERKNALYRNNWDGTFSNVSRLAGVELSDNNTVGVAVGDIDNDGDEDLLITTGINEPNVLLENQGDGTFTDISKAAGLTDLAWSTSASFGDVNLDGLLDIYINNYAEFSNYPFASNIDQCSPNFLYLNQGNNQFVEAADAFGVADIGCGLAVAFTDCDGDNDMDLYVANDFGLNFKANELYLNAFPENNFNPASRAARVQVRINAMGVAIGDYDEDGDFDYYVTNIADNPFFENTQSGRYFRDVANLKKVNNPDGTSWGTAFLDYNNDTYLDLVVANGQVIAANYQNDENRLFRGNSQHTFENVSQAEGIADTTRCRGLSMADLDQDGDLDIMMGVVTADNSNTSSTLIYQNNTDQNQHWLKVKVQGLANNRNGYGSHVTAIANGRRFIREVDGGSSYLSHSYNEIHFGLGELELLDSLVITWPTGQSTILTNVSTNQSILVVENGDWMPYVHKEVPIFEGDSIWLADAFQRTAGVYHNVVSEENGTNKVLEITRLTLAERPVEVYEVIEFSIAPNPFVSSTTLTYTLPQTSQVELIAYDQLGRRLANLVNESQAAGKYSLPFDDLSSGGVYFFQLRVGEETYLVKAVNTN
ncbi:MAG: FG-GAP-like repeat-containing protein [Bacteroidota bacterium]